MDISKLFNRTISNSVIQGQGRMTTYHKNNSNISIDQDGVGIKNAAKIFEVINTLPNDSVFLVEEIAQNLNPGLIEKFLDMLFAKLEEKNIQHGIDLLVKKNKAIGIHGARHLFRLIS